MTLTESAAQGHDPFETVATWFGDPDRPLLGWASNARTGAGRSGVVAASASTVAATPKSLP